MGDHLSAVDLGAGRRAIAIEAGGEFACALLDNKTVRCWGLLDPSEGISRGDEETEIGDALPVLDTGGERVTAMSAQDAMLCLLLESGSLRCWGPDEPILGSASLVALGTDREAVAVTAGGHHACALFRDRGLKCWGSNTYGELGLGDTRDRRDDKDLGDALPVVDLGGDRFAVGVSASDVATCVVLNTGSAACWGLDGTLTGWTGKGGRNELGGFPDGTRGDAPGEMGESLALLSLQGCAAKVVPGSTACALLRTGHLQCWGVSQIEFIAVPDAPIQFDRPIVDLDLNGLHACAVLDTGQVLCWGPNDTGFLGQGDRITRPYFGSAEWTPVQVDLGPGS